MRVKMFWYSAMDRSSPSLPDRQVEPPAPPFGPAARPEGAADDDAARAPEARGQRDEEAEPVDAEGADGVADEVAEEAVLVLAGLHRLAPRRVQRRKHQRPMQGQRQHRGEE